MQKILVLDDEADILAAVEIILTRENFIVKTISKWEKLPEALLSFDPHLILLDVALSGADGRDICEYLNTVKETKDIPIILFSANHDLPGNLNGCNPDAIITKPFDASHLVETINKYLAN